MNTTTQPNARFHVLVYLGTHLVDAYAFPSKPLAEQFVRESKAEDKQARGRWARGRWARGRWARHGKDCPDHADYRYEVEPCGDQEGCVACWDLDNRKAFEEKREESNGYVSC